VGPIRLAGFAPASDGWAEFGGMKPFHNGRTVGKRRASPALGRIPDRATIVPKPMLRVYEAIVSLTDALCDEHLDVEYRALSRVMAAALCRKRQS